MNRIASRLSNFSGVPSKKKKVPSLAFLYKGKAYSGGGRLAHRVQGAKFEAVFAVLIVLNAIVMAVELQFEGTKRGLDLGMSQLDNSILKLDPQKYQQTMDVFRVLEVFFGGVFMLEIFIKLVALRFVFFCFHWNIFDLVVVFVWFVDMLLRGSDMNINSTLLRLLRLGRLLRLLRLARNFTLSDTLMLMVSSMKASAWVLFWGSILLLGIMTLNGLLLNGMLRDYLNDEGIPHEHRLEVFGYFGTYTRCMVTMFEITLGNWVPVCRMLIEKVSHHYWLFVVSYRMLAGFSVVNVITGVFLHETFRCASVDDSLMIASAERTRNRFVNNMHRLFEEMDTNSDFVVSLSEFLAVMKDHRVKTWLKAMDITVRDPERFFFALSSGSTTLKVETLIDSMSMRRGLAQECDIINLLENTELIRQELLALSAGQQYLLAGASDTLKSPEQPALPDDF